MDLQLFAERTEEATPKRLQKAREEGRVARSQDLVAGVGLLAATLALRSLGPGIARQLSFGTTEALSNLRPIELTQASLGALFEEWSLLFLKSVLPIVSAALVVGLLVSTLQSRFLFTLNPLVPKLAGLNPITGLQRMFSLRTFIELVKGIAKLTIIGFIAYSEVRKSLPNFLNLMEQGVAGGVAATVEMCLAILQRIGIALLVLGILDYGYQLWEFRRSMRMTKDEVKREVKEAELPAEVKGKQRQKAREMAYRRRALKDVPLADVVVTNPTHYAVALKYDPKEGAAPKVLAKGADILAQRIKVIARQHEIPMVENRPLARGLYEAAEIGRLIPPEFYQAVAEVLAFVYDLRRQKRHETDQPRS